MYERSSQRPSSNRGVSPRVSRLRSLALCSRGPTMALQKRRLGTTDLSITSIGLGAWAIGGAGWAYGWGAQDDAASITTIVAAVSRGINWLDTAAIYGLGHSEEVVGRALREMPAG